MQDCDIVVNLNSSLVIKLTLKTYNPWEGYETPYPPAMGLIVPLLYSYQNGVGIRFTTKVDMPLNKENKPM